MPRTRRLEDVRDLTGKFVLVRVDHNCVKRGKVEDVLRIEWSLPTLHNIINRGGRLILMTHVNRPRDTTSGKIVRNDVADSVQPVVDVLKREFGLHFETPSFEEVQYRGFANLDTSISFLLDELRERRIDGIYLPNTRWFFGEEGKPDSQEYHTFARQLAQLADIFVNDAFGSWQPHVSTVGITKYLPSYAGLSMQKEISELDALFNPTRPFIVVIAGSKVDTKLGTLKMVASRCDKLILGGLVYNAYLCAKYGIKIQGVSERDVQLVKQLLTADTYRKVLELPILVESMCLNGDGNGLKQGDRFVPNRNQTMHTVSVDELQSNTCHGYFLDVDANSFEDVTVKSSLRGAKSIFVNAVMGFTLGGFREGTVALHNAVMANKEAKKYFAGGDTIQEFKFLSPSLYSAALYDRTCHFFTGGGTVLKALELGSMHDLETVSCITEKEG